MAHFPRSSLDCEILTVDADGWRRPRFRMPTLRRDDVGAELIGILSVGAALAALDLSGRLSMDRHMTALEARLDRRMAGLEGRIIEMVGRLTDMDRRMARVEGLLVGLGLSGRTDASSAGD